eukprot:1156564-Pelagomonas_calceolata.AAC.8
MKDMGKMSMERGQKLYAVQKFAVDCLQLRVNTCRKDTTHVETAAAAAAAAAALHGEECLKRMPGPCGTHADTLQDEEYYKRMPEPCDDELDMLDLAFELKET